MSCNNIKMCKSSVLLNIFQHLHNFSLAFVHDFQNIITSSLSCEECLGKVLF